MSVIQKLKSALPIEDESITRRTYECQECGNTFESTKTPDRAKCMECLSNDVREQD
jgi:predicted Zn-ribbon and HTH transcriptional regulator